MPASLRYNRAHGATEPFAATGMNAVLGVYLFAGGLGERSSKTINENLLHFLVLKKSDHFINISKFLPKISREVEHNGRKRTFELSLDKWYSIIRLNGVYKTK